MKLNANIDQSVSRQSVGNDRFQTKKELSNCHFQTGVSNLYGVTMEAAAAFFQK